MYRLALCAILTIAISGFFIVSTIEHAEAVCDGPCIPLTSDKVAAAAYGAGFRGGALVYSIAIAGAESGFVLNAINHGNSDDSTDYGLWQINSVHVNNPPYYDANLLLYDASYNATAAYQISSEGTNWCPWVTFWKGSFISWLVDARSAAQAIDSTVIRPIAQEFSRVRATRDVNVRATAGGSVLRTVTAGTTGTVLDAPQVQSFGTCPNEQPHYYIWWKIHWDDGGVDGWLVEDALARIDCHQYTNTASLSSIPQGFGVPWDTQSDANELLIKATCTTTTATLDLGKGDPLQYIYKTGYHYRQGFSGWMPVNYTSQEQLIGNDWYPKTAQGSLTTDTSADNYVLGYICTWNGSTWRCGCRDAACTQSYWQVQRVQR